MSFFIRIPPFSALKGYVYLTDAHTHPRNRIRSRGRSDPPAAPVWTRPQSDTPRDRAPIENNASARAQASAGSMPAHCPVPTLRAAAGNRRRQGGYTAPVPDRGAKKRPAGQIAIPAQKPLGHPHIDRHAHRERVLRLQPAHKLHKGAPHLRVNARIEPQPDASAASGHRCALPGRVAP